MPVATDDHIFPQFLGGRRTIKACKSCNDVFGHTFEGASAKQLGAFHVYISSWGLPLRSAEPVWKSAHACDGRIYDFEVGPTSAKPTLAHPIIERDDKGRIIAGEFPSLIQAQKFADSLIRKKKAKEVGLENVAPRPIDTKGLEIELSINPNLQRMALKMSVACAQAAGWLPASGCPNHVRAFLASSSPPYIGGPTGVAYADWSWLSSYRKPLGHVIYVHRRKQELVACVQFFGTFQVFCRLGTADPTENVAAFVGTLDPVTGEETFSERQPWLLSDPPDMVPQTVAVAFIHECCQSLKRQARERGATGIPDTALSVVIDQE